MSRRCLRVTGIGHAQLAGRTGKGWPKPYVLHEGANGGPRRDLPWLPAVRRRRGRTESLVRLPQGVPVRQHEASGIPDGSGPAGNHVDRKPALRRHPPDREARAAPSLPYSRTGNRPRSSRCSFGRRGPDARGCGGQDFKVNLAVKPRPLWLLALNSHGLSATKKGPRIGSASIPPDRATCRTMTPLSARMSRRQARRNRAQAPKCTISYRSHFFWNQIPEEEFYCGATPASGNSNSTIAYPLTRRKDGLPAH
jgi:hypothetical protein